MNEITVPINDLHKTAEKFVSTSNNLSLSMKELDDMISVLEKKWSGATQQVFYRKYKDLHQAMEGICYLMNNIATEMHTMANRIHEIDAKDDTKG